MLPPGLAGDGLAGDGRRCRFPRAHDPKRLLGAFVKEMMRQATLRAAEHSVVPTAADVLSIADELLDERAKLTRSLLGHAGSDDSEPLHPSAAMLSAVRASGLPLPPNLGGFESFG
jgi:hypothetical protein